LSGAEIAGATSNPYNITVATVSVPTLTYYSVRVTDTSVTPSSSCENVYVRVNPALSGTFVIDGQSTPTTPKGVVPQAFPVGEFSAIYLVPQFHLVVL
jgi:hypothetical protein